MSVFTLYKSQNKRGQIWVYPLPLRTTFPLAQISVSHHVVWEDNFIAPQFQVQLTLYIFHPTDNTIYVFFSFTAPRFSKRGLAYYKWYFQCHKSDLIILSAVLKMSRETI
jgi:hypothetical protein